MRTLLRRWSRPAWLRAGGVLCAVVFIQQSCRKMDVSPEHKMTDEEITAKFFSLPANASVAVKRVAGELKRQNEMTGFIAKFAAKEGYIRWDKAKIMVSDANPGFSNSFDEQDTTLLLPFMPENTAELGGFIKADLDGEASLYLYRAKDYSSLSYDPNLPADKLNAQRFAKFMMAQEKEISGTATFKITDPNLFPSISNTVSEKLNVHINSVTYTAAGKLIFAEICYGTSEYHCTNTGACVGGVCDMCPLCYSETTDCHTVVLGSGPNSAPTGSSTPTGPAGNPDPSSGGSAPESSCVGGKIINGNIPPGCGGGGTGWEPEPAPETMPTPCEKSQLLKAPQINTAFISLKDSRLNENREYGCIYTTPQDALPFEYKVATVDITKENEGEFLFNTSHFINGFFHVHPRTTALDGQSIFTEPLFSPGDLKEIYDYYQTGFDDGSPLINLETFTFGVINSNGDAYFLVVDDLNRFVNYATNNFSTTSQMNDLQKTYSAYTLKIQNSYQSNELEFMKFFTSQNMGMKVMKANANFSHFSEMELVNGQVIYIPC